MTGDASKLPPDLRKALNAELATGERVLYAAQPNWRAEWGKLLAILLFGLFWSSIAVAFFGVSAGALLGLVQLKSEGQPAGFWLQLFAFVFSLPFVGIGALFLAAPVLGIRKSRSTVHAITEARLLNVYTGRDAGAESYPLAKINFIKRKDRHDGTGNLQIGYGVTKDSDGDPRPLTTDWSGIPVVRTAEALIRENAKWVQ